jgi:hypothetical protein
MIARNARRDHLRMRLRRPEASADSDEVATFDEVGGPPALGAASRDFPQQRALADPARPVDQHDLGGRVVDEERLEERKLALATDEALLVTVGEAFGEGAGHGEVSA